MENLENEGDQFVQLERELFNTGPRANKTIPTLGQDHSTEMRDGGESSVDGLSNSAIPLRDNNSRSRFTDSPVNDSAVKRKRLHESTPKSERKITEFLTTSHRSQKKLLSNLAELGLARISPVEDDEVSLEAPSFQPVIPKPMTQEVACQTAEDTQVVNVPQSSFKSKIEEFHQQSAELLKQIADEKRRNELATQAIKALLIETNTYERKALEEQTVKDSRRIGHFKMVRNGDTFRETQVDGSDFEDIKKRLDALTIEKNEIAVATAALKKRKPVAAKRAAACALAPHVADLRADDGFKRPEEPKDLSMNEFIEQDEIYKLRNAQIKKLECELIAQREMLERRRHVHFRELRRAQSERDSRFKVYQVLDERYILLSMLGRGGFSEVWKAYDLHEKRNVACKMHRVNPDWREEKKMDYVKHTVREKDIQRSLKHRRIVQLFDMIHFNQHCFITVLEYCPGNDLDFYLKQNKCMSEKEARIIIMQIVSVLQYLSEHDPPIIHYDLKPANILLESGKAFGAIKITDFGLSKLMKDADDGNIELTSQFAGTYWYLPPETFVHGKPMISNKVDVWSTGVIFYECLYGRRPFGHDQSQQRIREENTIVNAKELVFPQRPQVSAMAQDFIRRCLQYKASDRADVATLCAHELLRSRTIKVTPNSPTSTNPWAMDE